MVRYAVVVDPYSTGRELAPAFAARGVPGIAVVSTPQPPSAYAGTEVSGFDEVLVWDGDPRQLDELASRLKAYDPLCVVPGSEPGVELADQLAARVLPGSGNPVETSAARRDKGRMGEALAAAGVPRLRQVCTADPDEVADWLHAGGLTGRRIVLKPPSSGGTDDVHVVEPGTDWRPLFTGILGRVNEMGVRNDRVLVQEYAEGVEYIVDLYSKDGWHGLVDVCRYTKYRRGDRIGLYDRVDFLRRDEPEIEELFGYASRVADAVGLRNGPGHAEVMMTVAGPRLLEIAARPAGGGHQLVTRLATGDCQIDRQVRHWVDGSFTPSYQLVRHVRAAFLAVPRPGVWRNVDLFDEVAVLPTFHSSHLPYRDGRPVPETTSLLNAFGWVILTSPDADQLHADYLRVKELERRVLVEPLPPGT